MKDQGQNQLAPIQGGIERRSRLFYTMGSLFVGIILVFFGLFLARHYVQNVKWVDYYYKNARVFANECSARIARSDDLQPSVLESLDFKPLAAVPHTRGFFKSWLPENSSGRFYHLEYRCVVSTDGINIGRGVNYMHLGWIFGEDIKVNVNGRELLHIKGEDFVSFPVAVSDLTGSELIVEVKVSSTDGHRVGLVSVLPPAISSDTKTHTNLLGIQPIFELSRTVVPAVPSICLGFLLAFAWMLRVRTRIIFTAMFYFISKILASSIPMVAGYLPIAATKIFTLAFPFNYLTDFAVFCILLEIFGVWRTKIYSLMLFGMAFCLAVVGVLLAWDGVFPYAQQVVKHVDPIMAFATVLIISAGWKAGLSVSDRQKKLLMNATLIFGAAFFLRYINEISRHYNWGSYINFNFYFSFLMPLYLAGIVLYHLTAVELQLRDVLREREIMKNRLQIGSDLRSIVQSNGSGSDHVGETEVSWGGSYPADMWRFAWSGAGGEAVIAFGRIIGGEEHATVGTAGIVACLLEAKDQRRSKGNICIEKVNHMLFSAFRGYLRSSMTVINVSSSAIEVWSAGASAELPVLWVGKERHSVKYGHQFAGTSASLAIEYTKIRGNDEANVSIALEGGASLLIARKNVAA